VQLFSEQRTSLHFATAIATYFLQHIQVELTNLRKRQHSVYSHAAKKEKNRTLHGRS